MVGKFYNISKYRTPEIPANPNVDPPNPHIPPTLTFDATFQINSTKL